MKTPLHRPTNDHPPKGRKPQTTMQKARDLPRRGKQKVSTHGLWWTWWTWDFFASNMICTQSHVLPMCLTHKIHLFQFILLNGAIDTGNLMRKEIQNIQNPSHKLEKIFKFSLEKNIYLQNI
jgi:hypothetical protein